MSKDDTGRPVIGNDFAATATLLSFAVVASLLYSIFVYPISRLFTRESEQFKALKVMRLDALSRSLIEHEDLALLSEEHPKATEREMQGIVAHLSTRMAMGALSEYPQVRRIFDYSTFWVYLNGNAESERHWGTAFGFYLGVFVSIVAVVILC